MNNLILTPIPLEELITRLRQVIQEEVRAEHQKTIVEKLLSPAETCKLFEPAISKMTLTAWTNAGHLTRYQIGGRVFYKQGEILSAAKNLHRRKSKKS